MPSPTPEVGLRVPIEAEAYFWPATREGAVKRFEMFLVCSSCRD